MNALMPGSETGSLPRSAVGDATAWQTSLLTTLSYCALYTWAVEHQVQAAPAREPAPLVAQPAPLVAPALARCAAAGQQQAQVQQPAAQPPVEAWPEAPGMGCTRRQDLLANRPSPYPSQVQRQSPSNKNRCWKCERDVGGVGQYKHSRVAAASPSSRPPQAVGRLSSWPRLMAIPTPSPSRVAASPLFSCCSRLRPPAPPPRRDSAVAVLV